jgi:large subunit ribosomal protein L17
MKHHKDIRKLGRVTRQRKALMRQLASALIEHEKIKTTEAKAKELRPMVEKLVTKARNNTLAAQRLIISRLGGNKKAGSKLIKTIGPRYKDREGGYTRVTKLPPRKSDASKMAIIEFV